MDIRLVLVGLFFSIVSGIVGILVGLGVAGRDECAEILQDAYRLHLGGSITGEVQSQQLLDQADVVCGLDKIEKEFE